MTAWRILTLLVISCLGSLSLDADDALVLTGSTMGTSYRIKLPSGQEPDRSPLQARIDARLAEIDQRMSTYRDDSEISRFNRAPLDEWVVVHEETARLVQMAEAISRETAGAFDATVGPAVELWNFGPQRETRDFQLPSDPQVAEARSRMGYDQVEVRLEPDKPPALRKLIAGLQLDLSAIAKGYAVDRLSELLRGEGFPSHLVEIGGEVRVHGSNQGAAWRIGIEAPDPDQRRLETVVSLQEEAMASSGDYRNFYRHAGKMISHTIDPRTGRPVEHRLASVTVIADSCARADALATALLVMGPEARAWADQQGIKALLLWRDGATIRREATASFPPLDETTTPPVSRFVTIAIAAAVIFGLAILAMSIGTLVANKRLQGSCGGIAGLRDEHGRTLCDLCVKPSADCTGPDEPSPGAR